MRAAGEPGRTIRVDSGRRVLDPPRMTDNPYAISLDELEGSARVAGAAQVQEQAQLRYADLDRSGGTPLAGGDSAGCDGD